MNYYENKQKKCLNDFKQSLIGLVLLLTLYIGYLSFKYDFILYYIEGILMTLIGLFVIGLCKSSAQREDAFNNIKKE